MPEKCTFDYATIRVVPRVEREEFINVGIILSCPSQKFLEARIELDEKRLQAIAPKVELDEIRRYLAVIPKICAGNDEAGIIGKLTQRERFFWLTAQRSTIIQTSPIHSGFCTNADETLEKLLAKMVRR